MPVTLAPVEDPIPRLKETLAREIIQIIQHHHDCYSARWLRCDRPRVSDLKHGRHARFSLEKLIRFMTYLDRRVDLHVTYAGLQRNYIMKEKLAGRVRYHSFPPPPSNSP